MFLFPLLIFGSIFILSSIVSHLGQTPGNYYDFVAFIIVWGGTLSVGIALLPWEYRKEVTKAFGFLIKQEKSQFHKVLKAAKDVFETRESGIQNPHYLYEFILKDGAEYIQLGLSKERIMTILEDQIAMSTRRLKRVGLSLRNLAKYPPAFGLVGTVLGLVNLMRSLNGTADASRLGTDMSIALVATMYGLLVANFLVSPLAEFIMKKVEEEEEYADLALEAISLVADQASTIEFIEQMNALVPPQDRFENGLSDSGVAA
jgi:chemotaxis protein MotA